jgi:hypothetical protein
MHRKRHTASIFLLSVFDECWLLPLLLLLMKYVNEVIRINLMHIPEHRQQMSFALQRSSLWEVLYVPNKATLFKMFFFSLFKTVVY